MSARQRAVLEGAAAGLTERETGRALGLAEATVRKHLASAREALGARSTAQAVARAVAAGLIRMAD